MNNGFPQQHQYPGMGYNPCNGAQYKPTYHKPLPQSTSPVASFNTGYETYDFPAPPVLFRQQQQYQQYQHMNGHKQFKPLPQNPLHIGAPIMPNNYNNYNISSDKRKKRSKHRHKQHRDSDSPPPPPPTSSDNNTNQNQNKYTRPLIYKNIATVASHLKLIGGKNSKKSTFKNKKSIKFLKDVLLSEVLFSSMKNKFDELISVMYKIDCPVNQCIIKQNEFSDTYFIIESGAFDIMLEKGNKNKNKKIKKIGQMLAGKTFGDASLLYRPPPSAATLKATQFSVVWALDAVQFREIRQKKTNKTKPLPQQKKIYKKPPPLHNAPQKHGAYKNKINCKLSVVTQCGLESLDNEASVTPISPVSQQCNFFQQMDEDNQIHMTPMRPINPLSAQSSQSSQSSQCNAANNIFCDDFVICGDDDMDIIYETETKQMYNNMNPAENGEEAVEIMTSPRKIIKGKKINVHHGARLTNMAIEGHGLF